MKQFRILLAVAAVLALVSAPAFAQAKAEKKQTCCQKAFSDGKECKNKCCVSAHRNGKSCEKCNPNKEDLELLKKGQKSAKK